MLGKAKCCGNVAKGPQARLRLSMVTYGCHVPKRLGNVAGPQLKQERVVFGFNPALKGRLNEMENQASTPESNARFWQSAHEYHGALASAGDYRLAISPNGKRYQVQRDIEASGGSGFVVLKWRKSLSLLAQDMPPELLAVLPALPDDPLQYHRPWAGEMQAASERFNRANPVHCQYAGVIASGGHVRLVWLHGSANGRNGPRYALQVALESGGWKGVAVGVSASSLRDRACRIVAGDLALQAALDALPERPGDYTGRKPERQSDVKAALGRVSVQGTEARHKAGEARLAGSSTRRPSKRVQRPQTGPQGGLGRYASEARRPKAEGQVKRAGR